MIRTTIDEIRIIIYLIGFGIFTISTYDILFLVVNKLKKYIKIIVNIIYILLISYFTYQFSYALAKGYVPIHFILFLIIGFLIYYLIREKYLEGLKFMYYIFRKIKKLLIEFIIFLCYPKEVISIIFIIMKRIKKTIRDFLRVSKKKNKKRNNKLSK